MRTIKTTAVIIAFWGAIVNMQASNPKSGSIDQMTLKTVERINEIAGLESTQKVMLTEKVKNHIIKVQLIQETQDKRLMIAELRKTSEDFRLSMDSILTAEQKTKLAAQRDAVRMAIAEKNKDKKRTQTNNK